MTLPPQATSGDLQNTSSTGPGSSAPIGDTARELAEQAKREGAVKADAFRTSTSQKVNAIAEGARAAAGALKQEDVAQMSQYLERFAGSLQHLSGTIREKSGEELLQEANRLARENPTMFMTACVAIGFGLGRFAKAAPPEQRANAGSGTDTSGISSTSPSSLGGSTSSFGTSSASGAAPVGSSSISDRPTGGTMSSGGSAAAGSTPGVSEFSGSSAGPGASSVGEGGGTAGSRLAGGSGITGSGGGPESRRSSSDAASGTSGSNIKKDEAGGLSS